MALHESVAVAMADGYAQAAGRPAFVNLHSACGVGNAMGAVVNAWHNRAPLVITGGNQDRRHLALEPYLFARGVELMAPYVKHAEQPARAEDVPAALDRAWVLAQTRPYGPVFVSVPADDWDAGFLAASPAVGYARGARRRRGRRRDGRGAGAAAERRRRRAGGRRGRRSRRGVDPGDRAGRAARRPGVGGAAGTPAGFPRGPSAVPRPPRPGLRERRGAARRGRRGVGGGRARIRVSPLRAERRVASADPPHHRRSRRGGTGVERAERNRRRAGDRRRATRAARFLGPAPSPLRTHARFPAPTTLRPRRRRSRRHS